MGALTENAEGRIGEVVEPLREAVSAPEVDVELEDAPAELFEFGADLADLAEVADTDTLAEATATGYEAGPDPTRAGR